MSLMRKLLLALAFLAAAAPAWAAGSPEQAIGQLYTTLLDTMKNAEKLGLDGRRQKLAPAIDAAYNLPLMARLSVGPQWKDLSPEEQKRFVASFRELTLTTYAARFDGFSGEKLIVEPQSQDVQGGKIVHTKIVKSNGEPIQLNYLMRQDGDAWKIIDVYLKGTVSELATRRSEFSSVLRREGAQALLEVMDRKIAEARAG
jgi:phospholipid transport system substrate-binding protein